MGVNYEGLMKEGRDMKSSLAFKKEIAKEQALSGWGKLGFGGVSLERQKELEIKHGFRTPQEILDMQTESMMKGVEWGFGRMKKPTIPQLKDNLDTLQLKTKDME